MNGSVFRRACAFGVLIAALSTFVFAGTASGQATVGTFFNQETVTSTDVSLCTGLSGTVTNTVTEAGRFVANADGTVHVSGTTTQDYRVVWSDGSYQIHHSPSHFEVNANATGFVVTEAQQDRGTLYAADGQVIGKVTVFTLTHQTWRDLNGNGQPEPGEFTAIVDQFRVTCP
jgi:hypothetical protein